MQSYRVLAAVIVITCLLALVIAEPESGDRDEK
jgi:hypothetical protein